MDPTRAVRHGAPGGQQPTAWLKLVHETEHEGQNQTQSRGLALVGAARLRTNGPISRLLMKN